MEKLTHKELESLFADLLTKVDLIDNSSLRKCTKDILFDYKTEIFNTYGSRKHNHFKGGLLKHTLEVVENSLVIFNRYSNKFYNKDIVLVTAILHDIGKIKTHQLKLAKDEPDERLLTHSIWSVIIVNPYLDKYNIDEKLKLQILHCIHCHMLDEKDNTVYGTMHMIEQYIVHIADGLDAKLSSFVDIIEEKEYGGWFKSNEINFVTEICKSEI